MRSNIVKENYIALAVSKILLYRQTTRQISCYFQIKKKSYEMPFNILGRYVRPYRIALNLDILELSYRL